MVCQGSIFSDNVVGKQSCDELSSLTPLSRAAAKTRPFKFSSIRTRAAVTCTASLGSGFLDIMSPACPFYLSGRGYFAAASSPICLPMAVPTSVELR